LWFIHLYSSWVYHMPGQPRCWMGTNKLVSFLQALAECMLNEWASEWMNGWEQGRQD
jgi:hypothetical protein